MLFERYLLNYLQAFNQLDRKCWNYEDGCVLIGADMLYKATGNQFFKECLQTFYMRNINPNGSIKHYEASEYNIDRIPPGRPLFTLHRETNEPKYRIALSQLMRQLQTHPRTKSGNFWHKNIYPNQIWLDGLYMGLPFYLEYSTQFGQGEVCQDVVKQFKTAHQHLYNPVSGLYYHAYDESKQVFWADKQSGISLNYWSRAIGWLLLAMADCYALLPKGSRYRATLGELWQQAIDGMLRYQSDESGLFYQLTALPAQKGNYFESSASAMVAYSLYKGIRLGLLPYNRYYPHAQAIMLGLATHMLAYTGGQLSFGGICMGAGLGPAGNLRRDGSVQYYLSEPVVTDEQKGVGVLMMAVAEEFLVNRQYPPAPMPNPKVAIFNREYISM